MIDFLCEVGSEFESEAFRALLEIDNNEIDPETGCSISGLILDLLHKYEIKIGQRHLSNLGPNAEVYAYENNLLR